MGWEEERGQQAGLEEGGQEGVSKRYTCVWQWCVRVCWGWGIVCVLGWGIVCVLGWDGVRLG